MICEYEDVHYGKANIPNESEEETNDKDKDLEICKTEMAYCELMCTMKDHYVTTLVSGTSLVFSVKYMQICKMLRLFQLTKLYL